MDYTYMSTALQNQWNLWNIRGFMILSLCMQILLALVAPYRQKTSNRFVIFIAWSAYLLADWAAIFVFGLISNAGGRNVANDMQVAPDVMAFWAAFLLVHLGGLDTITAFSMEDNALWMRHLIALIAKLSVFIYIFMKTLPHNRLLVPTILIFVTGVINYGERVRALNLASLENLKKTIEKATVGEQIESEDVSSGILKGLIVDIRPDLQECNKSRENVLNLSPEVLLLTISREQNHLYELLYTKIKAANSTWGRIARAITYYSTLVAFILFCTGHKHQFHGGDLAITYTLFAGVFVLHAANMMTLLNSSFKNFYLEDLAWLIFGQGIIFPLMLSALVFIIHFPGSAAARFFLRSEWSFKLAYFNTLSHCFEQSNLKKGRKLGFIWNKLAGEKQVSWEEIDIFTWDPVYKYILINAAEAIDESRLRELYEARGDQALRRRGCDQLMRYIKDFHYENTLLIWHIATEICFNVEAEEDYVDNDDKKKKRLFSKKLSDYMMYLLVRRPNLMSAVAGISHIRYKDTYAELEELLGRKPEVPTMQEFCRLILAKQISEPVIKEKNHAIIIEEPKIIEENNHANISEPAIEDKNHGFSVLKDSCGLVRLLREDGNRWEVIYEVWEELLAFAASHCRVDSHVRLLNEGSEYITSVWILMSLCGIGDQFPVDQKPVKTRWST